jgi:hypothetical protein
MRPSIPPAPLWFRDIWHEFRDGMHNVHLSRSTSPYVRQTSEERQHYAPAGKPRRPRKPSIMKMIAAAERDGRKVTSITTPDGVTLNFDKGEDSEASNPWLADLDKVTKQ